MPRRKKGRPPHEPDINSRRLVEFMAGIGRPHEEICGVIGITKPTLYKNYKKELSQGKAKVITRVSQNLVEIACKKGGGPGTVAAAIFFLKIQAGWTDPREPNSNDPANSGGTTIVIKGGLPEKPFAPDDVPQEPVHDDPETK